MRANLREEEEDWHESALAVFRCSFAACAPPRQGADKRVIVRTTLRLQGLQAFCNGHPLLQNCTVLNGLDGSLNQLFLVTTPDFIDPNVFLQTLRSLPGIKHVELDALLKVMQATDGGA